MATLTTVTTALETKIDALVVLTSRVANSQFRDDLDSVPAGETRYQIRGQYESDDGRASPAPKKGVSFIVEFHHHIDIAGGDVESDHVEGDMVTLQSAMTGVKWWKTIAGVFEVSEGPDLSIDLRRDGNLLSYGVGAKLVIQT